LIFSPLRIIARQRIVRIGRSRARTAARARRCAVDRHVHGARFVERTTIIAVRRSGKRKIDG
jgi:hypothetical protein